MKVKVESLLAILLIVLLYSCGPSDNSANSSLPASTMVTGNPAIDGLSAEILKAPRDADLYARRGALFYENEGYDQAIEDMDRAIQLDSSQASYRHLLADVQLDYYQSREALETMEAAAEDFPDRIPTLLKLSEFQLILQQYEASMRTLDKILKMEPQEAEAYFMFGMNFKEVGDTARAINSFQEAVELDSRLIDGWIYLGQLQAAMGNSIAGQYFNTALAIQPNYIPAIHAKADYLKDIGDLSGAVELYGSITALDPQYEEAYFNSGLLYMEMDSLDKAFQRFDLCLQVEPTHVRAYFFRGLSSELKGDRARAKADYVQALRLSPEYEQPREGLSRLRGVQ